MKKCVRCIFSHRIARPAFNPVNRWTVDPEWRTNSFQNTMKMKQRNTHSPLAALLANAAGFTRIELFACVACAALLAALALPVFATSRSRSDVVQCLSNLRQVGLAVQMWGADYQDDPPWRMTNPSLGGGSGPPPGNAWFWFASMSNQLATPRLLACPADNEVLVASDFPTYVSSGFRSAATSYSINLHTLARTPAAPVFGDRNISLSGPVTCPYAATAWRFVATGGGLNGWTNAIHGEQGNVVLMDGSVMETTSEQLRSVMLRSDPFGSFHLLTAR